MIISKLKYAKEIGTFYLTKDSDLNKINIEYHKNISAKDLTEQRGHVYLIVSDNEIKKIGGTRAKGGIKATISFYVKSKQGGPSIRSFGIQILIENELKNKKEVKLWLISNPRVKTKIYGLATSDFVKIAAFKESENLCKREYKKINKRYPPWNYQENKEKWPDDIKKRYRNMMKDR